MQNETTVPRLDPQQFSETFPARFWAKVQIGDGCWLWIGGGDEGYGGLQKGRKGAGKIRAHVASWMLFFGPVPNGLFVLHKCDVRRCIRPDHLFLGTQADNMADMIAKGRAIHPSGYNLGEDNPNTDLTNAEVLEIRELYSPQNPSRALAKHFGVSKSTILRIVHKQTWAYTQT